MNGDYMCGDGGALAAYLYNECDPEERARIEAHVAVCAACAAELAALGAARSALAAWAPPETELGFQIVSAREADQHIVAPGATVLRPARWWRRPLPAWAQVAAAIVIFAVGGVLGMRAGSSQSAAQPAAAVAAAPDVVRSSVTTEDLAALEQRVQRQLAGVRAAASAPQSSVSRAGSDDDQIIARVRSMLAESEQRQQRELALRLTQVMRDVDSQRRVDLALIERTLGHMEGVTGPELRQQREAINYLIRRTAVQPQ